MNGNYDRPGIPMRRNTNNNSNMGGTMNGSSNSNNSGTSSSMTSDNNSNSSNSMNNVNADNMNWLEEQIRQHPEFRTPTQQAFNTEEMMGSIQQILAENIGAYVVVEFLIGTDRITRKQGYLYHVGTSYITLYDDDNENFILCDIFSVKFVYFYLPGQKPNRNFNMLPHSSGNNG